MRDTITFCGIDEISSRIDTGKTLVVTDRKIGGLFGPRFPDCPVAFVPEGESAKSWESLAELYKQVASFKLDRSWKILAIGGGSVSDLAGFAAHTWMRGIGFLVAPTTLLAMGDAALGGKNGIDFQGYKNIVGSFHLPEAIFCDVETLRTLEAAQFASGMAEVVKHAIIDGEGFFSSLERALAAYGTEGGFAFENYPSSALERIVSESQRVKLGIVARDPEEAGERRILNLGHSFGHAVEIVSGLPHGHAVSIGLALACSFACDRGFLARGVWDRIAALLSGYGLPVDFQSAAACAAERIPPRDFRERAAEALFMDKKREGGWMNLAVPRDIGRVTVEKIPVSELMAFLDEVEL